MVAGCDQTPAQPESRNARVTFCKYEFNFDPERSLNVEGHRDSIRDANGAETKLDEDITIQYGNLIAKIVNGKLTVDGKDQGTVKPGDRFTLIASGKLSLNDVQR